MSSWLVSHTCYISWNYHGMPLQASNVFIVEMIAIFGNFKKLFLWCLILASIFPPKHTIHTHEFLKHLWVKWGLVSISKATYMNGSFSNTWCLGQGLHLLGLRWIWLHLILFNFFKHCDVTQHYYSYFSPICVPLGVLGVVVVK